MVATGCQDQLLTWPASRANAVTITTRMDQVRQAGREQYNSARPSMNQPRFFTNHRFWPRFLLTYGNECVTMDRAVQLHTSPDPSWQSSGKTHACNPCISHTYKKPTCKSFIYCTHVNTGVCTLKSKPQANRLSILDFAVPDSDTPPIRCITASRIHPFDSPHSLLRRDTLAILRTGRKT